MVDFPISDSQYLGSTIYPTLEIGIEELLKKYFPNSSGLNTEQGHDKTQVVVHPVRWLANWLKNHNNENQAKRIQQKWDNAVAKVQIEADNPTLCCQNLVDGVKEAFWPIQVRARKFSLFTTQVPKILRSQAYIAVLETVLEQRPVDPPAEAGDSGEGQEEPPADEDDGDAAAAPPPMQAVEVDVLRYIASSHPGQRGAAALENRQQIVRLRDAPRSAPSARST